MSRSLQLLVLPALLSCSICLSGCISHTTVYKDEDPVVVKTPKPEPTKKTSNKSGSSSKDPVVIVHQHKFHYYPVAQVYRDCETKYWFWYEGGVWKISTTLPKTIALNGEKPCVILLEGDNPQEHHTVVAKQYPPKALEVRPAESSAPKKSLPPQANGLAKGHDKQNARADARAEADAVEATEPDGSVELGAVDDQPEPEANSNDQGQQKKHDDDNDGKGSDKENGKDKEKDKDKSGKHDKKSDKAMGKKKD